VRIERAVHGHARLNKVALFLNARRLYPRVSFSGGHLSLPLHDLGPVPLVRKDARSHNVQLVSLLLSSSQVLRSSVDVMNASRRMYLEEPTLCSCLDESGLRGTRDCCVAVHEPQHWCAFARGLRHVEFSRGEAFLVSRVLLLMCSCVSTVGCLRSKSLLRRVGKSRVDRCTARVPVAWGCNYVS
jgi:hypothetical protein